MRSILRGLLQTGSRPSVAKVAATDRQKDALDLNLWGKHRSNTLDRHVIERVGCLHRLWHSTLVAADGTSEFRTVEAAIDSIPTENRERAVVYSENYSALGRPSLVISHF